jgi:hypothetical protein
MIEGLIDGERRGQVLAGLAIGRMRTAGKLADLSQALTGRFTDHHAMLCRLHRDRIALFSAAVAGLEAEDRRQGRAVPAGAGAAEVDRRVRRRGGAGVAGRDRPGAA